MERLVFALLDHKNGRVERSSATLNNGPVEELIGIQRMTLQGNLDVVLLEVVHFLIAGFHSAGESEADGMEFIETHLYELFFGLVAAVACKLVSDVLHRLYLPLLLLRLN